MPLRLGEQPQIRFVPDMIGAHATPWRQPSTPAEQSLLKCSSQLHKVQLQLKHMRDT
jgi:hypothetical protein